VDEQLNQAYRALGLEPGAPWDDVRAAHRRLAKELHPDVVGGDARAMASVNIAFATLVANRDLLTAPPPPPPVETTPRTRTDDDPVTFSVNVLPVEAFEAVLIATSFLGDPWVIDEPYELSALLDPPIACRCLLSLAPEAGSTMVTVRVAPRGRGDEPPSADEVADAIIAELVSLDSL
jgi:hypothetical protein